MSLPVTISDKGHSVHLKWHRARRFATDPVFTGTRILEGLRAGASVEVDIVLDATDGMVILHNEELSEETTGRGLVRETSPDVLRQLHLRGNDGTPLDERVMLLDDLVVLLDGGEIHPDALLQLDLKENLAALSPRAAQRFRETLQPVARHVVLSGGDAAAVRLLARDLPGLMVGYDPCHEGAIERLRATWDFAAFTARAVGEVPEAKIIYLDHQLVLSAAAAGHDLVAACHAAGKRVDAYTINTADARGMDLIRRLVSLKVDQITTDDPEGVAARWGT